MINIFLDSILWEAARVMVGAAMVFAAFHFTARHFKWEKHFVFQMKWLIVFAALLLFGSTFVGTYSPKYSIETKLPTVNDVLLQNKASSGIVIEELRYKRRDQFDEGRSHVGD